MSDAILSFAAPEAQELSRAGGKGASLARLVSAGFPVPPGFVVATDAYAEHVAAAGADRVIAAELATMSAGGAELERGTAAIRAAIVDAPVPAGVAAAARAAYRELGEEPFVAVRSSGTAEDLAEASFAGLHDTYLDVRGEDDLLDAIRRCWASMWSTRAAAYRIEKGFSQEDLGLAVVVMEMIDSEASGVLFTANPVTAAVDEYVVNGAWGLGEGIVSGEVNPDELVLDRGTLTVKRRHLGSKETMVVRDAEAGSGVRTVPVAEEKREQFVLSDEQLAELGQLGRRLSERDGEWPQDVEWAWARGRFYVLQARDITGIELCWDEDLEEHGLLPRIADKAILSRKRADTVWTGRITPLFYSLRAETRTLVTPEMYRTWAGGLAAQRAWGHEGEAIGQVRWYKYLKGAVYFNSEVEYRNQLQFVPPRLRDRDRCEWTPPSWLEDFDQQPGSWRNMLRIAARIQLLDPKFAVNKVFATLEEQIASNAVSSLGLEPEQIARLSDSELARYLQKTLEMQSNWVRDIAYAFYLYVPYMTALFDWMLEHWYGEGAEQLAAELVTGLPAKTFTVLQNEALTSLANRVRRSDRLRRLFDEHPGAEFFERLDEAGEEGREFLAEYRQFLAEYGHRGQADRDIWYDRRCEDPGLDHRSIALLLEADDARLGISDADLAARRLAATEQARRKIRRGPLGPLKVRLFDWVHQFMLRFYVFRDNSRHHTDRGTFAKKRAAVEVGRRVYERGLLERPDDFYYLAKDELLRLLAGDRRGLRLAHAKVAARRRNCERYRVEWSPPMYIRGDSREHVEPEEAVQQSEDGVLSGVAMSSGAATGRARVIRSLELLGRLEKGDVLIAHGTDPGWTPAFPVLAGLVLETGGALAHGALLSREYGIPAVQVTDAMELIADGATVHVNGTSGQVTLVAPPPGADGHD